MALASQLLALRRNDLRRRLTALQPTAWVAVENVLVRVGGGGGGYPGESRLVLVTLNSRELARAGGISFVLEVVSRRIRQVGGRKVSKEVFAT